MRILHVIRGLGTGGSEMMLYKLLSQMNRDIFEAEVISLTDVGPIGPKIQSLGIRVQGVGIQVGRLDLAGLFRLYRRLREARPDFVQTWMYHADLLGGLATRLAGRIPLAWNIRGGELDPATTRKTTLWTARACALLSRVVPHRIICCSEESRRVHIRMGYDHKGMMVIPNGFDMETFRPDPGARAAVRAELGIPPGSVVIGLVARFDPLKDHRGFVHAASRLVAMNDSVRFLLCGDGIDSDNHVLTGWIHSAGLQDRCHLLGRRDDIPRLTAALDIASSSSYSEGFPNVLGEAMACEVPCVATDAGDSALIIGDTGRVIPPRNPEALARGWEELIKLGKEGRMQLGRAARRRIQNQYGLPAIAARYENLYREMATPCAV